MRYLSVFGVSFFYWAQAGLTVCAQVVKAPVSRVGPVLNGAQIHGAVGMGEIGVINERLILTGLLPTPALSFPVSAAPAVYTSKDLSGEVGGAVPGSLRDNRIVWDLANPGATSPKAQTGQPQRLREVLTAIKPALRELGNPSSAPDAVRDVGQNVMNSLIGTNERGSAVLVAVPPSSGISRALPVVSQVSYADVVTPAHRDLFAQTLRRRKAGWLRGLARMDVKNPESVGPVLRVKSAEGLKPKMAADVSEVRFTVEWSQSKTHLGSFKVTIRLKDMRLTFSHPSTPNAPQDKQILVRLRSIIVSEKFPVDVEVTSEMIAEFFEERGLRVLAKPEAHTWLVAVTGEARADVVSRELSGEGLVLFATPVKVDIPESRQILAMFKKKTVVDMGIPVETVVDDAAIAKTLREAGLLVLASDQYGPWRLGVYDGVDAEAAAANSRPPASCSIACRCASRSRKNDRSSLNSRRKSWSISAAYMSKTRSAMTISPMS